MVEAEWDQLQALPFTQAAIAEIRRPEFIDTVEDLPDHQQDEGSADLSNRVRPPSPDAPSGLSPRHRRSAHPRPPGRRVGDVRRAQHRRRLRHAVHSHGTLMAGLALYGPLDNLLITATVALRHRLESVEFLPDRAPVTTHRRMVSLPPPPPRCRRSPHLSWRSRVFCMPITTEPDLRANRRCGQRRWTRSPPAWM